MQPRSIWPESLKMRVKHKHKKLPSKHSCALKTYSFKHIYVVNTHNNLNLWFLCLVTTRDTFINYSTNYLLKNRRTSFIFLTSPIS